MYKIPYKMVEIVTESGETLTLEDVLKSLPSVPMTLYTGNDDFTKEKINDVINYLKANGGGQFTIPENPPIHKLTIDVHRNKFQDYVVHFIYNDYRYPIGTEKRPYTGEPWQAGDIIYNLDILNSDDKCTMWFCKVSGSATSSGTWSQQSIWQLSSSEIDDLVVSHVGSSIGPLVQREVQAQGPAMMSSEVTTQLKAKVPSKVESEVSKQLATTVPTQVANIVNDNLSREVSKRVDTVVAPIINSRLSSTLSDTAVTKMINDKVDPKVLIVFKILTWKDPNFIHKLTPDLMDMVKESKTHPDERDFRDAQECFKALIEKINNP